MKKWEYTIAQASKESLEGEHTFLNTEYGEGGWECFQVSHLPATPTVSSRTVYYFKRELPATPDGEDGGGDD